MPILSEKERLLRKIQACSFALVEANLYLASPLLDAFFHCRTPEQRFSVIREIQPGVLDE